MNKSTQKLPKAKWSRRHAAHLLKRASFSGSKTEVDECYSIGLEAAVKLILSGRQPGSASRAKNSIISPRSEIQIPKLVNENFLSSMNISDERMRYNKRLFTLQVHWLQRMLGSGGPREKMVLFWHGMLTSSYFKVGSAGLIARQNQLFREFAFGDYRKLIKEVLLDPAMVIYLDIDKNKRSKPNENFARELLEMFTLGEGNYSPELIKKLAKDIVGLRLRRRPDRIPYDKKDLKGMETNAGFSDQRRRLSSVIDSIFKLPLCGELLVRRLWKFYLSEDKIDETVVKYYANLLRKSKWNVSVVLKKMFLSNGFYDDAVMGQQIKSPVQYLVQAHKEVGALTIGKLAAFYTMKNLGQSLFNPPNVSGWLAGTSWINETTLSARYELASIMGDLMLKCPMAFHKIFYEMMKENEKLGLEEMLEHFIATSLPAKKFEIFQAMAKRVKNEKHTHIFILYIMCMPEYQMC